MPAPQFRFDRAQVSEDGSAWRTVTLPHQNPGGSKVFVRLFKQYLSCNIHEELIGETIMSTYYIIRDMEDYNEVDGLHFSVIGSLGNDDVAFVAKGAVITSAYAGFVGFGPGITVGVQGDLSGATGVVLGDSSTENPPVEDERVTVYRGGSVIGVNGDAIVIDAIGSTVDNAGELAGDEAVHMRTFTSDSTQSRIHNSGTMTGATIGVYVTGGEQVTLNNTGEIYGGQASFYGSGGTAKQVIVNRGTMFGDIAMGSGSDLYDGRHGTLEGAIQGGAGYDRIYAGAGDNLIAGGAGSDTIYGGAGQDTFILINDSTGYDTIKDFDRHDDHFELDMFSIFRRTGPLGAGSFKLLNGTPSGGVDSNDRILYDEDLGQIYLDRDGSGTKYDRVLLARITPHTDLDDSYFVTTPPHFIGEGVV
jgi:Ca2+-binding RTX toxin-like protein